MAHKVLRVHNKESEPVMNDDKDIGQQSALAILQRSSRAYTLWKTDGAMAWWNPSFAKLARMSASEIRALNLFQTPVYVNSGLSEAAARALDGQGEQVAPFEGAGTVNPWIEASVSFSKLDLAGEPYLLMQTDDLTEANVLIKQRQQGMELTNDALDAIMGELQDIVDTALVGLARTKMRRWVWVNPYFANALGYEPEDLRDQPTKDLYLSDYHYALAGATIGAQINKGLDTFVFDVEFRHKNGSVRTFEARGRVINTEFIESLFALRDVTHEREQTEKLQLALDEAKQASLAKDRFLRTISHELRTPLNGIMGALQAMQWMNLPAKAAGTVGIALEGSSLLLAVLNDILDYARTSAGQLVIEPVAQRVLPLFEWVEAIMRRSENIKALTLQVELDRALDEVVLVDGVRLRQLLLNLVNNALKFTPAGSVTLSALRLADSGNDLSIQIRVADTGIGMSEETVSQLFQPFMQADTRKNRAYTGTGLGLAIVKSLVDALGGQISVQSTVGLGTTFTVELVFPRTNAQVAKEAEGNIQSAAALSSLGKASDHQPSGAPWTNPENSNRHVGAAKPFAGRRIGVVDDNAVNRKVVCTMLEHMGAVPQAFKDGYAVLQDLETSGQTMDALLVDLHMAPMDGWELAQQIRARTDAPWHRMPLITVSGNLTDDDRASAKAAGMQDFVSKPVVTEHLRATLSKWL